MDTTLKWTLRVMLVWWCVGWPLIAINRHAEAVDANMSRDLHRSAYHECMGSVAAMDGHVARAEINQAFMVLALDE